MFDLMPTVNVTDKAWYGLFCNRLQQTERAESEWIDALFPSVFIVSHVNRFFF